MVRPAEIDRVDLLYGPFSAAYSGNSVGAVVDYVTRMPQRFEAHAKLGFSRQPYALYGRQDHFDAWQTSASLGDRAGADRASCSAASQRCLLAHPGRSVSAGSPKAALSYSVNDDWVFKASTGRAVRFSTVSELYQGGINAQGQAINHNPELRPEKSWTSASIAEWAVPGGQVRSTLFHEDTRAAPYAQLNTATQANTVQNVDRIRTSGLELAASAAGGWTDRLLLATLMAPAAAHVALAQPQTAAGSHYSAVLRLSHGCAGSATHTVVVQLLAGFRGAKPSPKAGWALSVRRQALAQPYDSHGRRVSEEVVEVVWTARGPEHFLADAGFDEFSVRGPLPLQAGPLWFKLQQLCEIGRLDWTEIPVSGTATGHLLAPAVLLDLLPAAPAGHPH